MAPLTFYLPYLHVHKKELDRSLDQNCKSSKYKQKEEEPYQLTHSLKKTLLVPSVGMPATTEYGNIF